MCDISIYGNFGDDLNIKDYSNCEQLITSISHNPIQCSDKNNSSSNTDLINITLNNNKSLMIKKSSLCWLLDNKIKRVSNDRLRRFINTSNQKPIHNFFIMNWF